MFVDYNYYKNVFGGSMLTETEFNQYGNMACTKISSSTLSRVTDSTINGYPSSLVSSIKNCACVLAQWFKRFQSALDTMTNAVDGTQPEGIIKSKSAGAVSVTYDTTSTLSYFLDQSNQEQTVNSVLKTFLYPQCIDGKLYNLLSKNLSSPKCDKSYIINI